MRCTCGRKAGLTIRDNRLLGKKDRILVGVSGGKDSMLLVHLLKKHRYDVTALMLDEGIRGYRDKTIPVVRKYCKKEGIPLAIVPFKKAYGKTVDYAVRDGEHACSVCGVFRRDLLNKYALKNGFTKVATGH